MAELAFKPTESDTLEAAFEQGDIQAGNPLPIGGAHQYADGVNFVLFSRHATRVRLELYQNAGESTPIKVIELDPARHRTGDIWHVWLRGVPAGQLYGYRIEGPYQPEQGHRFNPHRLLLDPFARAIAGVGNWDFSAARGYDSSSPLSDLSISTVDNAGTTPKCVFTNDHFDWEMDAPPKHAASDTVIYETHVRGFTIHPSSGLVHPGTFIGLTEKIPYLQDMGVTAIELMPVTEFNENEPNRLNPITKEKLKNYWGYNPVAFFAPKQSYGVAGPHQRQSLEFREMVKAFHRAGIEVILDIVLNHTAEGNETGPTISLRGIENSIFYMLQENGPRYYKDFTGTGNTLNANHPIVREFVRLVLRYWVMHMHVDGFRFDLASVLGRDEHGNILQNPPLLESIAEDPLLRDVKLIAEAWDAGGAYQVGSFSTHRWMEWNGRFRDDVRRFWIGDPGMMGLFASRICGSSDLYQASGKGPGSSLNFVTSHDGFTLNDLVSYKQKHNHENGENSRDGSDANYSDNCGVEGPSDDPAVEGMRNRLIKTFLLTLFVSRGVPMLLGGDEFRRTQRGNNNAYCQDNEVSWFDWNLAEKHKEIRRFARGLIAFRRAHPVLRREVFYTDADIKCFAPRGDTPEWTDGRQKAFACRILGQAEPDLFLMFNADSRPIDFLIPDLPARKIWRLAVDTSRSAPDDFFEPGKEPSLQDQITFRVEPRSSAILLTDDGEAPRED
ncbi:MAG TPA: glycogen debranching protein GlgX [Verrucomicrobiae bacterium]|nr:glycogen debranching protein GlgX [Verrucomicrobiae bacterium]